MSFEIRLVGDSNELDSCYLLRMVVFVDEQKVPPWEEMDSFDEVAQHFTVLQDGKCIGTARLVDAGQGVGKIGRVAIQKEFRGSGVGRQLMSHVINHGFVTYEKLILDAQVSVIEFYEKLDFTAEGDVFLDCGIEHRRMFVRRPSLPVS